MVRVYFRPSIYDINDRRSYEMPFLPTSDLEARPNKTGNKTEKKYNMNGLKDLLSLSQPYYYNRCDDISVQCQISVDSQDFLQCTNADVQMSKPNIGEGGRGAKKNLAKRIS